MYYYEPRPLAYRFSLPEGLQIKFRITAVVIIKIQNYTDSVAVYDMSLDVSLVNENNRSYINMKLPVALAPGV
jgi:hypothetical protein